MNILVAVDPSQHAQEAIRFVKSMNWPKNSEIFLIHVLEMKLVPPLLPSYGPSSWDRVISQVEGKMVKEARIFLEKTKKEILEQGPQSIKTIVVEGLPGAQILQAVKNYRIDLVILGTRGLSNIKRFLLGSTCDWVMREGACSVLVIRGKLSQATMGKTAAKILLAADGSSGASCLVDMLGRLTFKTPPRVIVTHVVERPAFLEGWYWGKGKSEFKQFAEKVLEKAREDGASHLNEMSQRVKGLNVDVRTILNEGNPADVILKTAEKLKTKLIIVGAKGHAESPPGLLGGNARKVARYAACSVLVVRNLVGPCSPGS